jgi:hypothetical protein
MVAFVDDQMAVLTDDVIDLTLAGQTLDDGNIDNTGGLAFAALPAVPGTGTGRVRANSSMAAAILGSSLIALTTSRTTGCRSGFTRKVIVGVDIGCDSVCKTMLHICSTNLQHRQGFNLVHHIHRSAGPAGLAWGVQSRV